MCVGVYINHPNTDTRCTVADPLKRTFYRHELKLQKTQLRSLALLCVFSHKKRVRGELSSKVVDDSLGARECERGEALLFLHACFL